MSTTGVDRRPGWPRLGVRRWGARGRALLTAVVGAATMMALSACALVGAEDTPAAAPYVVNRDGRWFAGMKCVEVVTQAGVFGQDPGAEPDPDRAVWLAVSDPPVVAEFELFGDGLPGVAVVTDAKPLDGSAPLWVSIRGDGGEWHTLAVTLGDITAGQAATSAGLMPWQAYWDTGNQEFAC